MESIASSPSSFSCDLVLQSKQHVALLRRLHKLGVTLESVTAQMVHRYAMQWLPLVVNSSRILQEEERFWLPPPDIAWLWHCHRLAPARYQAFCETKFGRIVEPNPPFAFQQQLEEADKDDRKSKEETRQAWDRMFPGEPFFWTQNKDVGEMPHESCATTTRKTMLAVLEGFDIAASSQCQANFLWQVSSPRFADEDFLEQGVVNYYKFLQLKNNSSLLPLVPTYQIDLMWHTHMLVNTEQYNQDCIRVHGSTFHHDDSLDDRTEGSKLDLAFQATLQLWKKAYDGYEYVVPGGMYRGEPADVYYDTELWTPELGYDAGDSYDFGIRNNTATMVVAGSSSNGTNLRPWRDPVSSPSAFRRPAAKSRVKHVSNNRQAQGYVFGRGSAGVGYYSFDTRDAYQILYRRLKKREADAESQILNFVCNNCLCLGRRPTTEQIRQKESLIRKKEDLASMAAFVKAKSAAAGPDVTPNEGSIKSNMKKYPGSTYDRYAAAGSYPYPNHTVWVAAGCGGGLASGAGCGGGACGGGGCGGGGGGGGGGCGGGGGG